LRQSGNLQSLGADDGNHLIFGSTTSGVERITHTEFAIGGVIGPVSRLDLKVIMKSSGASILTRVYLYDVTTRAWIRVNASMVGTVKATRAISVATNPRRYVDAAGTVRVRIRSARRFPTHSLNVELLRVTIPP
jgi:hypothetical protein